MNNFKYRVYGNSRRKGWEEIDILRDKEKAIELAKSLKSEDYYSYLVIEHDIKQNSDFPIERGSIYKECRTKFVDSLKVDYEIKAEIIKPERIIKEKYDRAKKKAKDRKLSEDFLDR